jgi:hypothetical protein
MTLIQSLLPLKDNELYDRDFLEWTETTVDLLRSQKFSEIDLENLIEEIESMGISEKNALESNLEILLMHLLKYKYQPQKISNSWKYTIREHRLRIVKSLKSSPSLKVYFLEVLSECYKNARELATDETGLAIFDFPESSPFTPEQIIDANFLP